MLAAVTSTGNSGWVALILILSAVVPLSVLVVVVWWVLKNGKRDPDAARLHQQQKDYERAQRGRG